MRPTIYVLYVLLFFLINIYQLKNIKKFNNDILFDYTSLVTLFSGLLILYFKYNSISLSLLTIFIMIFIIFIYIKDVKVNIIKTILKWFLLINIYIFLYGTLRYFFF